MILERPVSLSSFIPEQVFWGQNAETLIQEKINK